MITLRGRGTQKGGAVSLVLNIEDFPDLISLDKVPKVNHPYHNAVTHATWFARHGASWLGNLSSLAEAQALMVRGWVEGAAKASAVTTQEGMASAIPQPESIRRRWVWGDRGPRVDCTRVLRGALDKAFRRRSRVRTTGLKIVTLGGTFGGIAEYSHAQMFWTGAQMIVATELLEQAGYQCDVRGLNLHAGWSNGKELAIDVHCKKAGEPLRLDTIAATFAHAGVWRTYGFMGLCRAPWSVGASYGATQRGHAATAQFNRFVEQGLLDPVDVFLEPAYSKDAAVRNILSAIHTITTGETA